MVQLKTIFSSCVFIICTVISSNIIAQNYSCVIPNQQQYFQVDSPFYYPMPNPFYAPYANVSPIKVMYFDSVNVTANGIRRYGFNTWKNGPGTGSLSCVILNGAPWMGPEMIEMSNGRNIFFNDNNDSIKIKTLAAVNDSWHLYIYNNGDYINAHLDSLVWMQMAGISDSVKCISLSVHDSAGAVITNHPINGKNIFLSKSNGLLKTIVFRDFPDNIIYTLHRRYSIPVPTYAEMFDFNVNDEFQYVGFYYPERYVKILAKSYTAGMDTVIYLSHVIGENIQYQCCPYQITNVTVVQDTIYNISYPYNSNPFYRGFPEQNIFSLWDPVYTYPDSAYLENYVLNIDSNYNYRPVYNVPDGYMSERLPGDSCYLYNNFEPAPSSLMYSAGLGFVERSTNYTTSTGYFSESKLVWYHKGNEYWGDSIPVITGINTVQNNSNTLLLYPNPNNGFFTMKFLIPLSSKTIVEIYNLTGERIYSEELAPGISTKDFGHLKISSGIYTCRVLSDENVLTQKLIVK